MSPGLEAAVSRYEINLGLAAAWLEARGFTLAEARAYRLGVVADRTPESSAFHGRLAIPYLTPAGVADIRFRALGGAGPKYLSRPGATAHLFNVGALWRDTPRIAICEGELDAIVMDLHSGIPAIGVAGVSAWKPHFSRLLVDYDQVLVIGDGDTAGREFATRLAGSLPNGVAVRMPDGLDVNDLYCKAGPVGLEGLVG